jgi:gas vesicle structural protein
MAERGGRTSLMDVLDRVLDKGIVIDATVRVAVAGIDLVSVDAKITVASIETYLQLAEDPRAQELGLVARQGRLPERTPPRRLSGSLGSGAPPPAEPDELGKAAHHEEPPAPEGEDPVGAEGG